MYIWEIFCIFISFVLASKIYNNTLKLYLYQKSENGEEILKIRLFQIICLNI